MNTIIGLIQNKYVFFYGILVIAFLLIRIPKVGDLFRVVNTLIHESGHAFFALITNGSVLNVKLKADTSGETITANSSFISKLLVSLSGYPASAVAAFGIFYCYHFQYFTILYFIFITIAGINLLLWVRNSFGIFWLLFFIGGMALLLYFHYPIAYRISTLFLGDLLILENTLSCITLLTLSWKTPEKAGDAANLAKLTRIPAFIWAVLFFAFSLGMSYITITRFFPL